MSKREITPAEWRTPTPAEEAEIARILAHTDAHTRAHTSTQDGGGVFFLCAVVFVVVCLYLCMA